MADQTGDDATPPVSVGVLGPVIMSGPAGTVPVSGRLQAGLLALLALNAGRPTSLSEVVDHIWGEHPPPTVRNAVQVHVHALRKLLASAGCETPARVLENGPWGYRLALPADATDVGQFGERAASAAVALAGGDGAGALERFDAALSCWRGTPLSGTPDTTPLSAVRTRLERSRVTAACGRLDALLTLGRHNDAAASAEALTEVEPYHEGLWARLMLALYRSGRTTDALAAFQRARAILADDLGLDPGPELTAIENGILRHDPTLLGGTSEARRERLLAELPWYPNPIVGRSAEVERIAALLAADGARLVTLLGPGGVGKTRVAVEVAQRVQSAGFDLITFVDLTALTASNDIEAAIRRALMPDDDETATAFPAALEGVRTLTVLDNAEHVLDRVAHALEGLLRRVPSLQVLVTSRIALSLRAERRFPLLPLAPDDALELFVDRARACVADFRLTEQTATQAARLCARLDHLPLALELVAARLQLFNLAALEDRLESDLLSISGPRDLPSRHSTLGSTVRWSIAMLSTDAADLLARLSVFQGGFTLASASHVSGRDEQPTLAIISELVESSMVIAAGVGGGGASDAPARFRMLETIRQFGADLLAEHPDSEATHAAHCEYIDGLFTAPITGAGRVQQLGAEQGNFGVALKYALSRDAEQAAAMVVRCARALFNAVDVAVVENYCACLLAVLPAVSPRRTEIGAMLGVLAYRKADDERALELLAGTVEELRATEAPHYVTVTALLYYAALLVDGKHPDAKRATEDTINAVDRSGDTALVGHALSAATYAARHLDDPEHAVEVSRRCVATARELGEPRSVCNTLSQLAQSLIEVRSLDEALSVAQEAVTFSKESSTASSVSAAHGVLGRCLLASGDRNEAVAPLITAVLADLDSGAAPTDLPWLAFALAPSEPAEAARLLGAAEALRGPGDHPEPLLPGDMLRALNGELERHADERAFGLLHGIEHVTEWAHACS